MRKSEFLKSSDASPSRHFGSIGWGPGGTVVPSEPYPTLLYVPDYNLYGLHLSGSLTLWGSASESHQEISGQETESGPLTSYTPHPQLQWGHNGCLNPLPSTSLGSPLLQLSLGPRTNWHPHPFRLLVLVLHHPSPAHTFVNNLFITTLQYPVCPLFSAQMNPTGVFSLNLLSGLRGSVRA